jgi:hypothetical protein
MQDITLRIWRNFPSQGVDMLKREGYKIKWNTTIPETGTHLVIVWHEHALAFQRLALRSQRFPEAYVVRGGGQDWLPPDWQTFFLGPLMVVPAALEKGPLPRRGSITCSSFTMRSATHSCSNGGGEGLGRSSVSRHSWITSTSRG